MTTLWLPLTAAVLDWLAVAFGRERLQALTKPGVIAAVLIWLLRDGPGLTFPAAFFAAGLVFSLIGDILLLPMVDRFPAGLAAFLLAHAAYILGLNQTLPPLNFSTLMFAGVIVLLASRILGRLVEAFRARGESRLLWAVRVYAGALGLMLFSGLATLARDSWSPAAALLAASGAVFFVLSDILLMWNRVVEVVPHARLKTRVLYQLGQILLAGGVIVQFS